jgi:hypothetical protein
VLIKEPSIQETLHKAVRPIRVELSDETRPTAKASVKTSQTVYKWYESPQQSPKLALDDALESAEHTEISGEREAARRGTWPSRIPLWMITNS